MSKPGKHAVKHSDEQPDFSRAGSTYHARRKSKAPKIVAIVVLAIIVIAGICGALYLRSIQNKIALPDGTFVDQLSDVDEAQEPYWVLILGSDSRTADDEVGSNSDVIMLVRVDQTNRHLTLVSIPRDTKVDIPGHGTVKINAAYSIGGAELAVDTVEQFAGIEIGHYAEIYFSGVERLVDSLGGLTIDVPQHVSYGDVTLEAGEQLLTGHEVCILARVRKEYAMGDFTRTDVQRMIVETMIETALAAPKSQLPGLVNDLAGCFRTDMTLNELVSLATAFQGITSADMYSAMAPSCADMEGGVSYTFTYINQWKLLMLKANRGEDPNLDDEEARICGYECTMGAVRVDMSTGLPEGVLQELQAYWDQQRNEAAEEHVDELSQQQSQ